MKHSTGRPTIAQKRRLDALALMPCIACRKEGALQTQRTEVHHIVDKGYRSHSGGHDATLPLCGYHHRGELPAGVSSTDMLFTHGPSFALSKRRFIETYGTERELLETVNQILEQRQVA